MNIQIKFAYVDPQGNAHFALSIKRSLAEMADPKSDYTASEVLNEIRLELDSFALTFEAEWERA